MKNRILDVSRQSTIAPLSPWFSAQLDRLIQKQQFLPEIELAGVQNDLVDNLIAYKEQANIENVVLGMSGGVDSALTASLFKEAGWKVSGYLLPINQDPEETKRGAETCEALGIPYTEIDLTAEAKAMANRLVHINPTTQQEKIRAGNIRARLRMITLYDAANAVRGLVASTDNFSELTAGFWTRFGDEGDLAPLRSLWKSWEVPMLARMVGLPESIYTATPTDGLGIDDGDEAQFGCSYLEWDIMVMSFLSNTTQVTDNRSAEVYDIVATRMKNSWFKRAGTIQLQAKNQDRFQKLSKLDESFIPSKLLNLIW